MRGNKLAFCICELLSSQLKNRSLFFFLFKSTYLAFVKCDVPELAFHKCEDHICGSWFTNHPLCSITFVFHHKLRIFSDFHEELRSLASKVPLINSYLGTREIVATSQLDKFVASVSVIENAVANIIANVLPIIR